MVLLKGDSEPVHTINEPIIQAKNTAVPIVEHVMPIKVLRSVAPVFLDGVQQPARAPHRLDAAQVFLVAAVHGAVRVVARAVVVLAVNNITTQGLKQWKI